MILLCPYCRFKVHHESSRRLHLSDGYVAVAVLYGVPYDCMGSSRDDAAVQSAV